MPLVHLQEGQVPAGRRVVYLRSMLARLQACRRCFASRPGLQDGAARGRRRCGGVAVWLVTQVFINNMWTTWQVTITLKSDHFQM
jgi:hypothetical protein